MARSQLTEVLYTVCVKLYGTVSLCVPGTDLCVPGTEVPRTQVHPRLSFVRRSHSPQSTTFTYLYSSCTHHGIRSPGTSVVSPGSLRAKDVSGVCDTPTLFPPLIPASWFLLTLNFWSPR